MFKNGRIKLRLTALFLAIIIFYTAFPLVARAADDVNVIKENDGNQKNEMYKTFDKKTDDSTILTEDISLRDEFSKHYIDSKGNRYIVVFPEQVHYKNNGKWIEIDNTLKLNATKTRYVSTSGTFKTEFSENVSSMDLVSIDDGEYTISWSVSFQNTASKLTRPNITLNEEEYVEQSSPMENSIIKAYIDITADSDLVKSKDTISDIGKAVSSLKYKGLLNSSIDLNYSILYGKLKEDVVINRPGDFSAYTLTVSTGELVVDKLFDNQIVFKNSVGEIIFTLGAPWMRDSANSVSNDIAVSVQQHGNVSYITYTPNSDWLNDVARTYPVVIDPSFTTRTYTSNYSDTYIHESDDESSTHYTEDILKVGNIEGEEYYSYLKIKNIPEIVGRMNGYVNKITLSFYANTINAPTLDIYRIDESWEENTISYENRPSTSFITSATGRRVAGRSYSKYDIDVSAILEFDEYDIECNSFFKSDSWNGFEINCNGVNENVLIYSSESGSKYLRPTLVINYSCIPFGATRDGAIYNIVNAASNKYLTVGIPGNGGDYGEYNPDEPYDIDGINVYQSVKNGYLSQAFRLDYNEENDCFRIRAMCVNNGYSSVLDYPSNLSNAFITGNLRIYGYDENWQDDQEWIITPYNSTNLFRIVSRADPDLAITAYGTADGNNSGTSDTSPGNVYVSKFTGASNQLWYLESGGIQVINGIDIKTAYETETNHREVEENYSWLTLCCPVDSVDVTGVTWYSSNTSVATVSYLGEIVAKKAGIATITAFVEHDDGDWCDTYDFTVYVVKEDGTYYFNNVQNSLRIECKSINSYEENSKLKAYDSEIKEPSATSKMFKMKYIGNGNYVIRSMIDCSMGWTCVSSNSTELVVATIGTSDRNVSSRSKWRIQSNANGYFIFNYEYGTTKTITSPSFDANVQLAQYTFSTIKPESKLQNWNINEITKAYNGVNIKNSVEALAVGSSYRFRAAIYSTYTGEYGQRGITWSVVNGTGKATIDSSTGILTGISSGTVTVNVKYQADYYNTCYDWFTVIIYISSDVKSIRMTMDVSNKYILCVAELYSGDKYWYQLDLDGNCSDILLLSNDNKEWLTEKYTEWQERGGDINSLQYCVYQAKYKLDRAIAQNQLYDVSQSSDEYFGLWLFFSLTEEKYREATLLAVQGVNTVTMFANVYYQGYVLSLNLALLERTVIEHNAAQILSGLYSENAFGNITNIQAVNQGITDITVYTGARPTWRQSETYAAAVLYNASQGYAYNKSFVLKDNVLQPAQWGDLGSIRPDFYNKITGHCVDVKNYTITTSSGRNNLVNNVIEQYNHRVGILPENTKYEVLIDVRGQAWTQDMLNEVSVRIAQRSDGKIIVSFLK